MVDFALRLKPDYVCMVPVSYTHLEWREWRPWIVLLKPSFGVYTPDAYRRWAGSREWPGIPYGEQRVDGHVLVNDLERRCV